jgi:hypothetical protein
MHNQLILIFKIAHAPVISGVRRTRILKGRSEC